MPRRKAAASSRSPRIDPWARGLQHPTTSGAARSVTLEELHGALVALRGGERLEGAEVPSLARTRVLVARIEAEPTRLELPDHALKLRIRQRGSSCVRFGIEGFRVRRQKDEPGGTQGGPDALRRDHEARCGVRRFSGANPDGRTAHARCECRLP